MDYGAQGGGGEGWRGVEGEGEASMVVGGAAADHQQPSQPGREGGSAGGGGRPGGCSDAA